jgi:predicted lipid-binding transport protein (Tim44 family)
MKRAMHLVISLLVLAVVVGPALAQDFYIYPNKGQSQEQLEKDKFECYSWAKQNTGFDPMETPRASEPPPPKQAQGSVGGGVVRGGAGGGLLGAGVGAIAGGKKGAKKGLAIGAVSGGAIGGVRSHSQQKKDQQAQQQWAQQQTNQYMQKRNGYNRAYSACLEGRGYTVK